MVRPVWATWMREGYDLPPLMFTGEEIVALKAGVELIRAWGGAEMARGAETALDKITTVLPDMLKERSEAAAIRAIPRSQMTDAVRLRIDEIEHAITGHTRLHLAYRDEAGRSTNRDVRPLVLLYWGPVWTLGAWCELREDFRMFRIDRIDTVQAGDPFDLEPGRTLRDFYAAAAQQNDTGTEPAP